MPDMQVVTDRTQLTPDQRCHRFFFFLLFLRLALPPPAEEEGCCCCCALCEVLATCACNRRRRKYVSSFTWWNTSYAAFSPCALQHLLRCFWLFHAAACVQTTPSALSEPAKALSQAHGAGALAAEEPCGCSRPQLCSASLQHIFVSNSPGLFDPCPGFPDSQTSCVSPATATTGRRSELSDSFVGSKRPSGRSGR